MAGIGIALRKFTEEKSMLGVFKAQFYSAILSAGSWVISISILLLIYVALTKITGVSRDKIQFLVAITYLTSASLILSGFFQQVVIRNMADLLFEKNTEKIASFLFSVTLALIIASTILGFICTKIFLNSLPWRIQVLMVSCFVTLNLLWIFSNALSGLKEYKLIVISFFLAYLLIFILAIVLSKYDLTGLLCAYYLGQTFLMTAFLVHAIRIFPMNYLFNGSLFTYCKKRKALLLSGLMLQLAFWIDKYLFWFSATTGMPILGKLSASPIYDLPMFVAFLTMIPGLATFFYEVEANFSRYYHRYYDAIRQGATLDEIYVKHEEQVAMAREGVMNVLKIQGIFCTLMILFAPEIMAYLHLAPVSLYLFRIDCLSSMMMVLSITIANLLYYLNKSRYVLWMTSIFFVFNLLLTWLSLQCSPLWYGYGFLFGAFISVVVGIYFLNHAFSRQTYEAFMLVED